MKDSPELRDDARRARRSAAAIAARSSTRCCSASASQPTTKNLVYLLLDGERLASLPAISRELDAMIEAKAGRVAAEVVSAKPLDPAQLSQITAALEKLSGKKVAVSQREDPDLLGGVVAKLGDTVYDGSLRTQLRTLRDELSK